MMTYLHTHSLPQGKAQGKGLVQDENALPAPSHLHPHPHPRSQSLSQPYPHHQSQFASPPPFSHPTEIIKGQASARLLSVPHSSGISVQSQYTDNSTRESRQSLDPASTARPVGSASTSTTTRADTSKSALSKSSPAQRSVAATSTRLPLGLVDGNTRPTVDANVLASSSAKTTTTNASSESASSASPASTAESRCSSRHPPTSGPDRSDAQAASKSTSTCTAARQSQSTSSASSSQPPSSPPANAASTSTSSETGPASSAASSSHANPPQPIVARPSTPSASSITLPSLRSLPLHLPPTPQQPSSARCPPTNHLATPGQTSALPSSRHVQTTAQASVTPAQRHQQAAGSTPASESLATPYALTHPLPYVNAYAYPYGPVPVGCPVYAAHPAQTPHYYLSTPASSHPYPSLPSHAFETPMPPRKLPGKTAGQSTGGRKATALSAKKMLLGTSPATATTPRETPRKDNHRALPLKNDMRLDPHYRTWGDEPLEPEERFQNAYIVDTMMRGDLGHIMRPAAWRWGPRYPETYLRRHPMHPQNRESQSEKSTDASAYKRVSLNPFDYLYYPNGPKVDKKADGLADAFTPAKGGEPSPQPGSSVRKSTGKSKTKANKDEPSTRASFTEHQVHVLQIALGFCKTPSAEAKQRLGAWLGIPTQKVNTWCMNYRTDPSPKRKRDELEKFEKLSTKEQEEAIAKGVAPLTTAQEFERHRKLQIQRLTEEGQTPSLKVMDKTVYDEDLCKPRRYPMCWLRRYNPYLANEEAVVQAIMLGHVTRDQFLGVHAPADMIHPYTEESLLRLDEIDYDIVRRPAIDPTTDKHRVHVPLESTNADELAAVRRQQAANGEDIYDPPEGRMERIMAERDREVGTRTHRQSTYFPGQTSIDDHEELLACMPTDPQSSPHDKASYYSDDMDDDAGPGDTPVKAGKRPPAILGERSMNGSVYRSAGLTYNYSQNTASSTTRLAPPVKRKVPDLGRATGNNIRSSLSGYKQRQFCSAEECGRKRQRSGAESVTSTSTLMHRPPVRAVQRDVSMFEGRDGAPVDRSPPACADDTARAPAYGLSGARPAGSRVSPRRALVDLHHPDRPTRTMQPRASFTRSSAEEEDVDSQDASRSASPESPDVRDSQDQVSIPCHLTPPPDSQMSRSSSSVLITPNMEGDAAVKSNTEARHVDVFDSQAHGHAERRSHNLSAYALDHTHTQSRKEGKKLRDGEKGLDGPWEGRIKNEQDEGEDELGAVNGQEAMSRHDNDMASLLLALRN